MACKFFQTVYELRVIVRDARTKRVSSASSLKHLFNRLHSIANRYS
jgi:hypothetical protein